MTPITYSVMNPKNTGTKVGIVISVLVVIALVVGWNLALPSRLAATVGPASMYSPQLYPTEIEGLAESCGDIYRWGAFTKENYPLLPKDAVDRAEIIVPVIESITVPVVGYLGPINLPKSAVKFYSRDQDPKFASYQVLRLMYSYNTTIIWYDSSLTDSAVKAVSAYVKSHDNVMALPWDPAARRNAPLPRGSGIAFASWGMTQNCLNWNVTVFDQYQRLKKDHPVKRVGESQLIRAKLNQNGMLPQIDPLILAQLRKIHTTPSPAITQASPSPEDD